MASSTPAPSLKGVASAPTTTAVAAAAPSSSVAALASNPLLGRYLRALEANPLRTKQLTAGLLSALAEVLAGHLAGLPATAEGEVEASKRSSSSSSSSGAGPLDLARATLHRLGINSRALKMFVYGYAVSAPLGHVLVGALQRAFAGRTSAKDKIAQIVVSQLTVTVISNVVYLSCMAIVNGARTPERVYAVLRAGLWRMLQVSWLTSPVAIATAQRFLPAELWEPFFTALRFVLSTYFNTAAKRRQVALAKRDAVRRDAKAKGGASAGAGAQEKQEDADVRKRAEDEVQGRAAK